LRQPWVGEHCVVQLPQYSSLFMTFAQAPLHTISPAPHIGGSTGLSGTYASTISPFVAFRTSPQPHARTATAATTKLRIPQSYGQTGLEIEW
jgi:hypothetical protein